MEDKSGYQKPLRRAFDKGKDLLNTYKKQEEKVIPIVDSDADGIEEETNENEKNLGEVREDKTEEDGGNFFADVMNMFNDSSAELEQIKKERDELKEQLIRKTAELENQRKRHLKEKQEMLDYANERLLFRMLELLDDITAAVDAGNQSTDYDALLKGMEMIRQKASKLYEEGGVKKMEDPIGKEFDVHFHEAMMMMPSEMPEGTVVQVLQPGYMIHEKVLRHARVITSSGSAQ